MTQRWKETSKGIFLCNKWCHLRELDKYTTLSRELQYQKAEEKNYPAHSLCPIWAFQFISAREFLPMSFYFLGTLKLSSRISESSFRKQGQ
ncbi:hypothetical protein CEXT_684481 [Caerostris extrusa]|uniref:Uncharacterized protein n=1 Tax=Caerostris extrusa TaxID=172846 RepID=A0AAV4R536_CAEEX|nr:hypothetical protein CEXT_684481 [Caerostris extrusa]